MPPPVLLDGPIGTELARRGIPTPLPLWSAAAIDAAPDSLARIHADYAAAGATVHTANTFRTDPYTLERLGFGEAGWRRLCDEAVRIARDAVPEHHRIAGSVAPLEDCYRPDRSPALPVCRREHGRLVRQLAAAGVDLLLCETFPHPGEALAAADVALETGLPVWLSLTFGPTSDLVTADRALETLAEAARRGVEAVLVNCSPPATLSAMMEGLSGIGVPFGAYGNVGAPDPVNGWRNDGDARPEPYAQEVGRWLAAGASIVGGCCGTTPEHIRAIASLLE